MYIYEINKQRGHSLVGWNKAEYYTNQIKRFFTLS